MTLALTTSVFTILRGHIEERTGLHFDDDDREVFVAKVGPRVEDAGFPSFLDYYYFLRYDPGGDGELEVLIEHLVVRETYLFRELDQLRALVDRWISPRVTRPSGAPETEGARLRVWSAACSTGDEPTSLLVLLAQANLLEKVELTASDLSRQALETAQKGRFSRRSLRALNSVSHLERWLVPQPDGSSTVDPALLAQVSWRRINLTDRLAIQALGSFDVILCRNVLIYFSDETTRAVVETLTGALRPGGALLVSVTESLLRHGTALTCEEHDGVFFYRRMTA